MLCQRRPAALPSRPAAQKRHLLYLADSASFVGARKCLDQRQLGQEPGRGVSRLRMLIDVAHDYVLVLSIGGTFRQAVVQNGVNRLLHLCLRHFRMQDVFRRATLMWWTVPVPAAAPVGGVV